MGERGEGLSVSTLQNAVWIFLTKQYRESVGKAGTLLSLAVREAAIAAPRVI